MSNIIIPGERTHDKQCPDWCALEDGTRVGDTKYCNLSLQCKQIGMRSDWYVFRNIEGVESFDYFCTGMYIDTEKEEKGVDEEVS